MSDAYVVVTPCRDEADYLPRMAESMLRQTLRPAMWIIADDGSSDQTGAIADDLASANGWIQAVHLPDRGRRTLGAGPVEAFRVGLMLTESSIEYVCKLDADLVLPGGYFKSLLRRMADDPRLGSASGKPYFVSQDGRLISEGVADDVSVGAAKLYRRCCLDQIGGLVAGVMWDGIDVHAARLKGWKVASWDDEALRLVHMRPMGASDRGILRGRLRWGAGQYFMGAAWWWILISGVYRMTRRPFAIGGIAIIGGYMVAAIRGDERYGTPEYRRFLRHYHWLVLTKGRRRAMDLVESDMGESWSPSCVEESPTEAPNG